VLDIPYGDATAPRQVDSLWCAQAAKLAEMIGPASPAPEFRRKYEKDPVCSAGWIWPAGSRQTTKPFELFHADRGVIAAEPLDGLVPLQAQQTTAR